RALRHSRGGPGDVPQPGPGPRQLLREEAVDLRGPRRHDPPERLTSGTGAADTVELDREADVAARPIARGAGQAVVLGARLDLVREPAAAAAHVVVRGAPATTVEGLALGAVDGVDRPGHVEAGEVAVDGRERDLHPSAVLYCAAAHGGLLCPGRMSAPRAGPRWGGSEGPPHRGP